MTSHDPTGRPAAPTPSRRRVLGLAVAGGVTLALPAPAAWGKDEKRSDRDRQPLAIALAKGAKGDARVGVMAYEAGVATLVVIRGKRWRRHKVEVDPEALAAAVAAVRDAAQTLPVVIQHDERAVEGVSTRRKRGLTLSFEADETEVAAAAVGDSDRKDDDPDAQSVIAGLVIIAGIAGAVAIVGMLTGRGINFQVKIGKFEIKVGAGGGEPVPGGDTGGDDGDDDDDDGGDDDSSWYNGEPDADGDGYTDGAGNVW